MSLHFKHWGLVSTCVSFWIFKNVGGCILGVTSSSEWRRRFIELYGMKTGPTHPKLAKPICLCLAHIPLNFYFPVTGQMSFKYCNFTWLPNCPYSLFHIPITLCVEKVPSLNLSPLTLNLSLLVLDAPILGKKTDHSPNLCFWWCIPL